MKLLSFMLRKTQVKQLFMLNTLLIFLFSFNTSLAQNDTLIHKVVRYYKDGTPRVEYCYDPINQKMVKEICFFRNGSLDYTGEYKNGIEHGTWTFYWENGTIRSQEFYVNGRENGVMYDYNEQGSPVIEYTYKMGLLLSEKALTP